jgi:hypothetical protein
MWVHNLACGHPMAYLGTRVWCIWFVQFQVQPGSICSSAIHARILLVSWNHQLGTPVTFGQAQHLWGAEHIFLHLINNLGNLWLAAATAATTYTTPCTTSRTAHTAPYTTDPPPCVKRLGGNSNAQQHHGCCILFLFMFQNLVIGKLIQLCSTFFPSAIINPPTCHYWLSGLPCVTVIMACIIGLSFWVVCKKAALHQCKEIVATEF